MSTLTVGVLQADDVLDRFQPDHGNYPVMFESILSSAGRDVRFRHYPVHRGVYPADLDECDGYVITGSRFSVYDDEPWIHELKDFVVRLHAHRKKLVGICFGHQMVAHALGGRTEPAAVGWGVGVHTLNVVDDDAFYAVAASPDGFNLVMSHKDQVTALPQGARLLASADHCPNASFQLDDHILTFQGHPEFTADYARDLIGFRREILGEALVRTALASLDDPLHREDVAAWILAFIAGETGRR